MMLHILVYPLFVLQNKFVKSYYLHNFRDGKPETQKTHLLLMVTYLESNKTMIQF